MATISWETGWDGPAHFTLEGRERTNLTSFLVPDHTNVTNRQNGLPFSAVAENASVPMGPPLLTTPTPNLRDPALARAEIGILGLVLALTTLGNGFVLWVLLRRRKHRAPMHLFMVNLCVADLVVAIFQVLPQLMWDITERFQGPDALCRMVKYLQIVGMFASSYMIVAMTVDRHYAICCPLQAYRGMATSRWNMPILVAWGLALILSIPQVFIFSRSEVSPGEFECWGHFVEPWGLKAYVTWMTVAVFVLPTLIITVCQVRIFREIHDNIYLKSERGVSAELKKNSVFFHFCRGGREPKRQNGGTKTGSKGSTYVTASSGKLLLQPHCGSSIHTGSTDVSTDLGHATSSCDSPGTGSTASDYYNKHHLGAPSTSVDLTGHTDTGLVACAPRSLHAQQTTTCPDDVPSGPTSPSVSKAMSKTVRMTLVIVLVYTLCWSPFFVVQLWAAWDPNPPDQDVAFTILMLLASLNSCTNPWIYTAFSSSVSRELQGLLRCRSSRSSRRTSLPDESTGTHTSTTARDSVY